MLNWARKLNLRGNKSGQMGKSKTCCRNTMSLKWKPQSNVNCSANFSKNIPILERLGLASPNLLYLWLPVGWLVLCEEGDCGSWRRNKKGLTSEICHIGAACGKNWMALSQNYCSAPTDSSPGKINVFLGSGSADTLMIAQTGPWFMSDGQQPDNPTQNNQQQFNSHCNASYHRARLWAGSYHMHQR